MSEAFIPKRATLATIRALVALVPWALLFGYIVANSTFLGEPTDWGEVARVSIVGLIPLVVAVGLFGWHPNLRSVWRGWSGVLMAWAVAILAFFVASWSLGLVI